MWDPRTYLAYADERGRPFFDLLARIPATAPRAVVDVGCGPGNLTAALPRRWPEATVSGLDSSPEMIARARSEHPGIAFCVADARTWRPGPDTDVVISNAVLQWVGGHEKLLTGWVGGLPGGATLAFSVPGNFAAPSHVALREVAPAAAVFGRDSPVLDAAGYAALLLGAGCAVDAWETTYLHLLPDAAEHPVLTWMDGTALRPYRAALDPGAFRELRQALGVRLAEAYPVVGGVVTFAFRRIFCVAAVAPTGR